MIIEHGVMHTEVIFNDTKTERYLLRKVWDEKKPVVCLIMTNPSSANVVTIDMTVHYSICNLFKLGYGGVDILNMTSVISTKIDTKSDINLTATNVEYIIKSAETADKVILAWGRIGENNKRIRRVQLELLEELKPFENKLHTIASETGEYGFHPLAPQIRFVWDTIPFVRPDYLQEKKDDKTELPTKDMAGEPIMNQPEKPMHDETNNLSKGKPIKKNAQIA